MTTGTTAQLADYLENGWWTTYYTGRTDAPAVAHHFSSHSLTYNLGTLTSAEQTAAVAALNAWAEVANLTFTSATSGASIVFTHNGTSASASENGNWTSGGVTSNGQAVNITDSWVSTYGSAVGTYGFQTYMHEIGHALGLGHQGAYNGTATWGTSNVYDNDSTAESVMSYFAPDQGAAASAAFFDWTPMLADVYAIQDIYGANTATNSGNTTYSTLDHGFCIWDTGGSDTIDASGYSAAQTIDLIAGDFSSVGGLTGNMSIAVGAVIENAIGGSGADTITGNSAANTLTGGAGDDAISGGDGNDTLIGGAGADSLTGGNGTDTADYSGSSSAIQVNLATGGGLGGDAQGDTLSGIETVIGSSGGDVLTGSSGGDSLYGSGGDDWLIGGAGSDLLDGGAGTDTIFFTASTAAVSVNLANTTGTGGDAAGDLYYNIENVTGSDYNDFLVGTSSANMLTGGLGNDALLGGAGADTLNGGDGSDTVYYTGSTAVQVNLATGGGLNGDAQGDVLSSIENVVGSSYGDTITGTADANYIAGVGGDDSITTGAGADLIDFTYGDGKDTITDFTPGTDQIRMHGYSGIGDFAGLSTWLVQSGSDVVFNYDSTNGWTLTGVSLSSLHSGDFLFI